MWLARMQMEVLRFPKNGVKMVAKVLNPYYAEVIQAKLQQQGIETGIGKVLDANNDLRLRSLSEGAENYFRQEQKQQRLAWGQILRDNLEKWVATGGLQDEEEVRQYYQPLFPKKVWPYFEELILKNYHYICSRMNPEAIAKEFVQDFFDLTEGQCLRLCRCYDAETHLLVEQALREASPQHEFCWLDCHGVSIQEAEAELRKNILPAKGQDEKENELYASLSRWFNRYRNHYQDLDDLKLVYDHHVETLKLPPQLAKIAAMMWQRYVVYKKMKKQQIHIQHLRCSNLKFTLETYFHLKIDGSIEPEHWDDNVTAKKVNVVKEEQKSEENHKLEKTNEAGSIGEIDGIREENGGQQQRIATMRENDAWLQQVKEEAEDIGPKYYAVAKGKLCGIFTDPELYEKALGRKENSVSEVFPSYQAAKKWLHKKREEAQAKKQADLSALSSAPADDAEQGRPAEPTDSVKMADSVPTAESNEPAKAAKSVAEGIRDSREYLLNILKMLPLAGQEDMQKEEMPKAELAGVRKETADFLTYAGEHHVDIIGRFQLFAQQSGKKARTSKQLAKALQQQEKIPSSYKLMLHDIFAHIANKKAGAKNGQGGAGSSEGLQEFRERLAADRAYFQSDEAAAQEPFVTEADAMRAFAVLTQCPLQTPADTYLFGASMAILFQYNCQQQKKDLPQYLRQQLGRLKQAKSMAQYAFIYTYPKDYFYLVVGGLRFRLAPALTDTSASPLSALLEKNEEADVSRALPLVWQRALACQRGCGGQAVTENVDAALAYLEGAMRRQQAVWTKEGLAYRWGQDPDAEVRANRPLYYLLQEETSVQECARFRYREDAEYIRDMLTLAFPDRHYEVIFWDDIPQKKMDVLEQELPAYGVYDDHSRMHFLLATARTGKLAAQMAELFAFSKNRHHKAIPLYGERESEIKDYRGIIPDEILHMTGLIDSSIPIYEEIHDFLYEYDTAVYLQSIFTEYSALWQTPCRKSLRSDIRTLLFMTFKRVRYEVGYVSAKIGKKIFTKKKWHNEAEKVFFKEDWQEELLKSAADGQRTESVKIEKSACQADAAQNDAKSQFASEQQVVSKAVQLAGTIDSRETLMPAAGKEKKSAAKAASQAKPDKGPGIALQNVSLFRGIQFDKHIFRHVPPAYQERFRRTFARRLLKMQTIFSGDRRAAGNDFKMVAGAHGKRVFKRRIGDHRLSMVYKDGILTLLALSSHDRQMTDIRKIRGKSIGYVYYDTADFLYQLDAWQEQGKTKHLSLGDYLATPTHFVFDEDQKAIIESTEKAENLSVIGNAGAGKSVVGLKWLREELQKPKNDALYLTMSENLVYTLQFEFEKEKAENAAAMKSDAEIRTTFDFLRAEVKVAYPQIPEKKLLNAAQSFAVFVEFWAEKVDWTQFWDHKDKAFAHQTEEMTRLSAWREIHGIIKGAVPEDVDYLHLTKISPCLREDEYQKRLQQEKKSSRSTVLWETTLYRVYEKYQRYLRRRELFDDNDMARLLLKSKAKNLRNVRKYGAVFVDECQDLTQMELLAIFHLLGGTRHKRMASDRCQMVQPTYFDEGWMRTASNDYDRANGRRIEDIGLRPRFLHYNYRSSRSIIDFQNYLVQFFRRGGLLTLRQDELREIAVPPLTTQGMKPVWVMAGAKNREHLIHDLWRKVPASDLQTIFAFAGSKSKEDFPWTEADAVTDIIHCKGMEYPSVLLYNILSETCDNPALAWKYFYVGATRGNDCLIIYEEAAKPGTKLYEFLEDAAIEGLIDYADDLLGKADYGEMTWLGYLYQNIHENTAENRHETAENALNFGQYELALSIYASEGRDENMTAYCRGRVAESHGDYEAAMRAYVSLAPDWSNRGRTRQNAAETLLTRPDVAGREFLAAYCLTGRGSEDLIAQAKEAWRYKYGEAKQRYFYEALFEALQTYPCLQQSFTCWREIEEQRLQKTQAAVQRAVAEWPLPEPTVRQDTAAGDTVLQVMAKLNETESEDDENVI